MHCIGNRRPRHQWLTVFCIALLGLASTGCLDSGLMKRFREAYAPGFIEGLSTALAQPGQAETGLRQLGVALAEGLGGLVGLESSSGSSSTSGSSSSSSSR